MDTTTNTADDQNDGHIIPMTPLSLAIYCSCVLLTVLCLILVICSIHLYCRSRLCRRKRHRKVQSNSGNTCGVDVVRSTGQNNGTLNNHKCNHLSQSTSSPISIISPDSMDDNRTGTITTVVQINLADIADGTTSMVRKQNVPSTTNVTANKIGTLPKYENTAVKSRKKYSQHNLLKDRPEPSPYDYPSTVISNRDIQTRPGPKISGYMEVLGSSESMYEAVDRKS